MVLCVASTNIAFYSHRFTALMKMYSVSYMWYAVIGTITCVVVGILVGFFTANENDAFDERLLHPFVAKIARRLPGRKRTFTTEAEEKVPNEKSSNSTEETIVETEEKPPIEHIVNGSMIFDSYENLPARTRL